MAFNCVGLLLFIFIADKTPLWFIITGLAIYGLGMGLFSSPNTNAIMGSVSGKFLGVASGAIGTTRSTGQMLSMGIVMILFSIYIGQVEITPGYYPAFLVSMRTAFIIFTALCFGGIFAQLAGKTGN
jgi:MFS family permease